MEICRKYEETVYCEPWTLPLIRKIPSPPPCKELVVNRVVELQIIQSPLPSPTLLGPKSSKRIKVKRVFQLPKNKEVWEEGTGSEILLSNFITSCNVSDTIYPLPMVPSTEYLKISLGGSHQESFHKGKPKSSASQKCYLPINSNNFRKSSNLVRTRLWFHVIWLG